MSMFTSSTDTITIGDTANAVQCSVISPTYGTNSTDLQYIGAISAATVVNVTGTAIPSNQTINIVRFDNVPVGNYILYFHILASSPEDYNGFNLCLSNSNTASTPSIFNGVTWVTRGDYFKFSCPYTNIAQQTLYVNFYSGVDGTTTTEFLYYYGYLVRVG